MKDVTLLYTTWPDADSAERAAREVVEAGLAACANILPAMRSVYRWKGAVEKADEAVMILKTGVGRAAALGARLAELHPYETPAIVAIPVAAQASWSPFLLWIEQETGEI